MFKINDKEILYPNNFIMEKQIVKSAEITTLSGRSIGDSIGYKYAPVVWEWGILPEAQLKYLLNKTNGEFTVTFDDVDGIQKTISANKVNFISQKTRIIRNDKPLFVNVKMGVDFPDVFN